MTCDKCGMWDEDCTCYPEIRPAIRPDPPGTENWFAGICDSCGAEDGKPCLEGCRNIMPPNTHCPQCGNTVGTPHNPWCPEAPHVKEESPF